MSVSLLIVATHLHAFILAQHLTQEVSSVIFFKVPSLILTQDVLWYENIFILFKFRDFYFCWKILNEHLRRKRWPIKLCKRKKFITVGRFWLLRVPNKLAHVLCWLLNNVIFPSVWWHFKLCVLFNYCRIKAGNSQDSDYNACIHLFIFSAQH